MSGKSPGNEKEAIRQFTKRHISGLLSTPAMETLAAKEEPVFLTNEQVAEHIQKFVSAMAKSESPQNGQIMESLERIHAALED